ncbi:MAG TPA: zf-HC2 domain-containing protein [Candidatus Omnitrophota bacterium]|nr:zf-HC2 domain-containing protein [Candidatus Omnitrophota bacterium]HPS36974.1 zf-HC2 domain-containing protein [Candidatus Omnitrophota bacterium]
MDCKKIREKLITDYMDHEADPQEALRIDAHLKECAGCRELLETARRVSLASLGRTTLQPDPVVWQRIREKIGQQREPREGWFEKLTDLLSPLKVPMPVFRAAFVTAIVLALVVLVRLPSRITSTENVSNYIGDQVSFLVALGNGDTELLNGDLSGYDEILEGIG